MGRKYVYGDTEDIVLATLGLTKSGVGRFRGVYIVDDAIAVVTRNGAGNREHWYDDASAGPDCPCVGCFMNYRVHQLPHYLYDEDDDDDPTYTRIYFEIPPEHAELIKAIVSDSFEPRDWLGALERLGEGRPEVAEQLRPIIEKLRVEVER